MNKLISLIFTLLWVLNFYGQEFGTHWIAYPVPDDSSEVLFRHVYTMRQRPHKALITFASAGHVKVYVNERNISRQIFFDNETPETITLHTYDITCFMRPDSNVIAVWYAPSLKKHKGKQLSLALFGTNPDGQAFYHEADGSWWCKRLAGSYALPDSLCPASLNETFDSRAYENEWKATDYRGTNWLHPTGAPTGQDVTYTSSIPVLPLRQQILRQVLSPIAESQDSTGLHYDFGRYFTGTIRLTLRNAKKGEKILLNGLTYICNGDMDEQAFRRLSTESQKVVTIRGDKYFRKSQIQKVEGLEIGTSL